MLPPERFAQCTTTTTKNCRATQLCRGHNNLKRHERERGASGRDEANKQLSRCKLNLIEVSVSFQSLYCPVPPASGAGLSFPARASLDELLMCYAPPCN
jgi:hypothetical protein